jgi:ABC-type branched-subunit amino acid transport system substrate-binding protein
MVKNKSLVWAIGIIAIVLILGGLVWMNPLGSDEEVIRIGVLYAQTGPASIYGTISLKGIEDAVRYVEEEKGIKTNLIIEDTQGDINHAVSAANKLISVDGIKYALTGTSGVTQAVSPIFENAKSILITDAAGAGMTENKEYLFQNLVPSLNNIAKDINANDSLKKIALVYINDDFGLTWSNNIAQEIEGRMVEKFSFERETKDYRTEALKIKSFSPDVIVVLGYPPAMNQVLTDLELQKTEAKKFIYLACVLPGILSDERYSLDNEISYEYPEVINPEIVSWFEKNNIDEEEYSNTFYSLTFENTLILISAAKEAGENVSKAREIIKTKKIEGLYGEIDFKGKNYLERDLQKSVILDGKCSFLQE